MTERVDRHHLWYACDVAIAPRSTVQKEISCVLPAVPHDLLKPSVGTDRQTPLFSRLFGFQRNPPTALVVAELEQYVRWYATFVDAYVRELDATRSGPDGRVEYARGSGRALLAALPQRIQIDNVGQAERVCRMLDTYRESVDFADTAGRGTLLVRLVEDIEMRLDRAGLLSRPITPTVSIAWPTPPRRAIAA